MKKGVFFGQNAVSGEAYDGWFGVLNGCVPDARDLALAFSRMGFETSCRFSGYNVAGPSVPWNLTLDCTLEAFHQVHIDWQAAAKPDDVYVIGNSGHGSTYRAANGYVGQTMCFADGQLADYDFHSLMCGWPAGVKVIYILDTCYSGGMDRDRLRYPVRAAPKWIGERNPVMDKPRIMLKSDVQGQVVQLCASQPNETSSDGPHNGAFTGTLLSVWEQAWRSRRSEAWKGWFEATARVMSAAFPSQHPDLNVLGAGRPLLDELAFQPV